jgi:N-acetylneuraminic acid mutarotase
VKILQPISSVAKTRTLFAPEEYDSTMIFRVGLLVLATLLLLSCDDATAPLDSGGSSKPAPVGTWTSLAPMPSPRQEVFPVHEGNTIYIIGGFDTTRRVSNRVDMYDIASNSWTSGPALPSKRHHIMAGVIGKTLFAISGVQYSSGWTAAREVYALEEGSSSWSAKCLITEGRIAAACVSFDQRLFVIGGQTYEPDYGKYISLSSVEVYDPASDTWEYRTPMPTKRNHGAAVVVDSLIYVIGGRYMLNGQITNLNVNEVYDPAVDTWTVRAPLPLPLGGISASALNGKIYIFGGEYFEGKGGVHPETWEYDPATDTWARATSMITPRHGTGAVTAGNAIYVIGGAHVVAFGASAVNERFSIPTQGG